MPLVENGESMTNMEEENMPINAATSAKDTKLLAYIPLHRNDLLKRKTIEIMKAIESENPEEFHPNFAWRQNDAIRLMFPTKEARDRAVEKKLSIFNLRVELELPRQEIITQRILVNLFGFPVEENRTDVENWLKSMEMTAISEQRWLTYKDCKIKNGGRSFFVKCPSNKEIPGYALYDSKHVAKRTIQIQIWYPNMKSKWCRRCMEKGHEAKDEECRMRPVYPVNDADPNSYASRARGGGFLNKDPIPISNVITTANDHQEPPQMEMLSQRHPVIRTNAKPTPEIEPFFAKESFMSNHFPCKITVKGVDYKSTEHFLFSEKAKHVGDVEADKRIMESKNAKDARKIGHPIEWDESNFGKWEHFAGLKLYEGNKAKYEGNADLRKKLFETDPKILVEANPNDNRWGVGLKFDDPAIHDPGKWRGKNLFGEILTKLRNAMMEDREYEDEAKEIYEERRRAAETGKKRPRCSSSTDSDQADGDKDDSHGTRKKSFSVKDKESFGT